MLKIKGIQKLLSVNPHLIQIEEYKDRYRLYIKDESNRRPLLFDIFRLSRDGENYKISLHSHYSVETYVYNSFDMGCYGDVFRSIDTFSSYMDIVHQTWKKGTLSGNQNDVSKIRPWGDRINIWSRW